MSVFTSRCVGILLWITAYVIIGDSAAPGGQLFGLVVLTVAANFGGWLVSLTTLPRLIGMLLVGILFQVSELNLMILNNMWVWNRL